MLRLLPPDDCPRLREFFSDAGYTFEALTAANLMQRASHRYGNIGFLLELTAEPTAFHTLARWFAIGVPVASEIAAERLPAWAIRLLVESGMLSRRGDELEPQVMLSPLGTMLIASDPVLRWEANPEDLVLWPNPTTEQLFHFTVRKPFASALDFGAGCGVQALGAAEHSDAVVATDLNPRAAEFTSFNARLNGIEKVECLTGDALHPVEGRSFDLIVANPPFFISPGSDLMFCENSLELDLFCRKLAREAPRHLNESGYFQMICEWVELQGQPWRERISEWVDSNGCDAWVIHQYNTRALPYGMDRAQQRPPSSDAQNRAFLAGWVDYIHRKKIVAVHGGLITLRKRSGRNWIRIEDEPVTVDASTGEMILAGFRTRDVLDSTTDEGLMDLRPRLAVEARLAQLMAPSERGWSPRRLRLQLTGSRPRQIDVDPGVAQFLGCLNGSVRLREAIRDLAAQAGAPMERVAAESIGIVRKFLSEGYLEL